MVAAARIAVLSLSLFFTPRYYHCCSAQQADDATQDGFELKQLHVVTRHGSRTTLAKDADSLAEEGGEILTPLGQKQLYDLGVWLRQTYHTGNNNNNATDGQPQPQLMLLNLGHYNPSKHRLESSNLDRTLSSANALSLGLFPSTKRASGLPSADDDDGGSGGYALYDSLLSPPPAVPVYSTAQGNDVHLRAFQNCPAFNERLQALYETDKWRDLEATNIDLLRMLARIFPEYADDDTGAVPLKSVWNVYDPIHVAMTECGTGDADADVTESSCDALVALPTLATAVTKSEFETLEKLTEHVEHLKFGTADVAGNLLGSNLWWKILTRAAAAADSLSGGEFFLYSAHAPTLLGLLSALQAGPAFVEQTGGEHFVEYGSALIVEVYRDATTKEASAPYEELYIRMRYKASDETEAIDIALKETSSSSEVSHCGGAASWPDDASSIPPYCSLSKVTSWATENTLTSEAEWCLACGNMQSDVCMGQELLVELGNTSGAGGDNGGGSTPQGGGSGGVAAQPWVIGATSFAVGFLSGLVMVGLVCLGLHRRRERERDCSAHGSTGCDDGIGAKGGGSSAGTADGEEEGATEAHAGAIASSNGLV